MLVIFTDTDTDLTKEKAKEFGYHLISMPYSIEDKTVFPYEDFETFDAHAFYDTLREGALPNTSAISEEKIPARNSRQSIAGLSGSRRSERYVLNIKNAAGITAAAIRM